MRQTIVFFLCAGISVVGLAVPQIALFGWVWFALMRPDIAAYSHGEFSYSLWMAWSLLLGGVRCLNNFGSAWLRNPMSRALIVLIVPLFISSQLAPLPQDASLIFNIFFRMSVACLAI